jgi:hypothetical protein
MRSISALCLIGVVDSIVFAAEDRWVFSPGERGGLWWLADAGVAGVALVLANATWMLSWRRTYQRLIELRDSYRAGEISDADYRRVFQQRLSEFA